MEFLRFSGEDSKSWIFKIEQFFSMEKVAAEEKVEVAAMQLEGEEWHLAYMRFGLDFDDPLEELNKVRQTSSVKEYQAAFERPLTRINLSEENASSCFLGGLKHELNIATTLTYGKFIDNLLQKKCRPKEKQ
ncbi:uncharacterized protein [Nicotiana sylvestris]|uniref:uncharacterized protein n=1 Tax=Nicotiana sylvestris TaxID=4096 RepID=UPI00388C5F7E